MSAHRATRLLTIAAGVAAVIGVHLAGSALAEPALFASEQLTPKGEYTKGIEGPAVDAEGAVYAVNFREKGTIGKLAPGAKQSVLFARLPAGSIGSGIRFDRDGRMYVADYKRHNVLVLERGQGAARIHFHSDAFNQPNDLAIAADGTLYASDPNFKKATGQLWRIVRGPDGKVLGDIMASERTMGVSNGIDLSPDGRTLYVSESNTREIWAYAVDGAKLAAPRLVKKFDAPQGSELDGLRTDIDGRILVARIGNGTVAMVAPDGTLVREIALKGKNPTNLTFGGPDGKTIYVTQADGGFIEAFRVDRPGREPCLVPGMAC